MINTSLTGKKVKLPGIDTTVIVLKVGTCETCNEQTFLIRPIRSDKPYELHADGYRVISSPDDEDEHQPDPDPQKTGGKHAAADH